MKLRNATTQDILLLKHWDTKAHVMAASGEGDSFDWENEIPRKVSWRRILMAENEEGVIGVIIIIDPKEEETHYWGNIESDLLALDIWIGEEEHLHKGYGTQMMNLALDECFQNPHVRAVLVDPLVSNTKALKFYERLGFTRVDRRMFGSDDCFVYRLEKETWRG